jgi:hypothetical protein
MAAAVIPADGTSIWMADPGETPVFAQVALVLSITPPAPAVTKVDTSTLTSGQVMTSRPGRTDPGEMGFELQFDPSDTQHAAIRALALAPATKLWQIRYPTTPATGDQFAGYVLSHAPSVEGADSNVEASVTVQVSGAITPYVPAS